MDTKDKKSKMRDVTDGCVILSDVDGKTISSSQGTAGSMCVLDVIAEHERTTAEDLLGRISFGGEVSMLLETDEKCGYTVAHMKNHRLFSVPVAEVTLYRNKAEYQAQSNEMYEKYGKVFGFVKELALDAVMRFSGGSNNDDTPTEVVDVPSLLTMISSCICYMDGCPFKVNVDVGGSSLTVCEDPEKLCGAFISAIVLGAKLSFDGYCTAAFDSDGEKGELTVSCRVDPRNTVDFRGFELSRFAELSPIGRTEVLLLDFFASNLGWDVEIDETSRGEFLIALRLEGQTDPDRLKFRESITDTKAVITKYLDYLTRSVSSDTEK